MSASSSRRFSRPLRRDGLNLTAVAVALGLALFAGALLGGAVGRSDSPARPAAGASQWIAHEGVLVDVPTGWARGDGAVLAGFRRPLGLVDRSRRAHASVERLPATSATLLPAAFLQTLAAKPGRPDVVRLASGAVARRYRFSRGGDSTLFYVAPTTGGVATVACVDPPGAADPQSCEALAGAVTVPGASTLAPSDGAAFWSRLPATLTELDAARAAGTRRLEAATRAAAQARAAGALARSHAAAGAALAPLAGGKGLPAAAVTDLATTATAYAALAKAARARWPRGYAAARGAVARAENRLSVTMERAAGEATAAGLATGATASTPATAPSAPKRRG
jgi:hypothetical protein